MKPGERSSHAAEHVASAAAHARERAAFFGCRCAARGEANFGCPTTRVVPRLERRCRALDCNEPFVARLTFSSRSSRRRGPKTRPSAHAKDECGTSGLVCAAALLPEEWRSSIARARICGGGLSGVARPTAAAKNSRRARSLCPPSSRPPSPPQGLIAPAVTHGRTVEPIGARLRAPRATPAPQIAVHTPCGSAQLSLLRAALRAPSGRVSQGGGLARLLLCLDTVPLSTMLEAVLASMAAHNW